MEEMCNKRVAINLYRLCVLCVFISCSNVCGQNLPSSKPCKCARQFRPVCGTDSRTYNSQCELDCAVLNNANGGLRLAYKGTCCPYPYCPSIQNQICDQTGMVHENECMFRYNYCVMMKTDGTLLKQIQCSSSITENTNCSEEPCSLDQDPICDMNGRTHQNLCSFLKAECEQRQNGLPALVLAYKGQCMPMDNGDTPTESTVIPGFFTSKVTDHSSEFTSTPSTANDNIQIVTSNSQTNESDQIQTMMPRPSDAIQPNAGPIRIQMGANREIQSVKSPAFLVPAESKSTPVTSTESTTTTQNTIESITTGEAPSFTTSEKQSSRKPSTESTTSDSTTAVRSLVIDNGNFNIDSMPFDFIKTRAPPAQNTNPTTTTTTLSPTTEILETNCLAIVCTNEYEPVCDTDGSIYLNECSFQYESCLRKLDTGITLQMDDSNGCLTNLSYSGQPDEGPTDYNFREYSDLDCDCTEEEINSSPVCDNELLTHANMCDLKRYICEQQHSERQIFLSHTGECLTETQKQSMASKIRCPKKPNCTGPDEPVCDSSGSTHRNVCEFAIARCEAARLGEVLTLLHDGECLPLDCGLLPDCDINLPAFPVCADDLQTYPNECLFKQAQCQHRDQTGQILQVLFQSPCADCMRADCDFALLTNPTDYYDENDLVCDETGETKTLCEFEMADCILYRSYGRNLERRHIGSCCPGIETCAADTNYVLCDNRNETHFNLCEFDIAACNALRMENFKLTVVYEGECIDLPLPSAPPTFPTSSLSPTTPVPPPPVPPPPIDCNSECLFEYNPVCGTDSRTYSNECHMVQESCATGVTIEIAYPGECCTPPYACDSNYAPVCDSRGISHMNPCHFASASCIERTRGNPIYLAAYGICASDPCQSVCTLEDAPVCASDGVTYQNHCVLQQAICLAANTDTKLLEYMYQGECCPSLEHCPHDYNPVCASDVTYINECAMQHYSCWANRMNKSPIMWAYSGPCCDTPCTDQSMQPVCDNNGQNHENQCLFRQESCRRERQGEPPLTVSVEGYCCKPTEAQPPDCKDSGPVCGVDGNTWPDACKLHNACVKLQYPGSCCALPYCAGDKNLVCDTSGTTHDSECHFELSKCIATKSTNTSIEIDYAGECCEDSCASLAINDVTSLEQSQGVCDQSGRAYNSPCEFNTAACLARKRNQGRLLMTPCPQRRQFVQALRVRAASRRH